MTDHLAEPDSIAVLMQFNQLIEELLTGKLRRCTFQPWEIGILVDLATCVLPASSKWETVLRNYQTTVQRQMQAGARLPLKLSEDVDSLQSNRDSQAPLLDVCYRRPYPRYRPLAKRFVPIER